MKLYHPKEIIVVEFYDSFTGKVLPAIKMSFDYDRIKMMRGEIREWIVYMKNAIDNEYRRTDKLHGKLLTKITYIR